MFDHIFGHDNELRQFRAAIQWLVGRPAAMTLVSFIQAAQQKGNLRFALMASYTLLDERYYWDLEREVRYGIYQHTPQQICDEYAHRRLHESGSTMNQEELERIFHYSWKCRPMAWVNIRQTEGFGATAKDRDLLNRLLGFCAEQSDEREFCSEIKALLR